MHFLPIMFLPPTFCNKQQTKSSIVATSEIAQFSVILGS